MTIDTSDESGGWSPVQRDFEQRVKLLEKQGYKVTSRQRSVFKNRAVKGNPTSQHLVGTAADFAVHPERVNAFAAAARKLHLQVVNEMNRPGHGAHMHVQAFPAGRTPAALFDRVQIAQAP